MCAIVVSAVWPDRNVLTIGRRGFDQLTARHRKGAFYYAGSDDEYHYFESKYFLERSRRYRMMRYEYVITNTFVYSGNTNTRIPWRIDLARGTEGFDREQVHLLSERSGK
jgi:hypothetical protein